MLAVAPNQTKIYYGFNAMLKELIYFPITKHQAMNLPRQFLIFQCSHKVWALQFGFKINKM